VHLLGQFNPLKTGCWLLTHGGEAAILEMPPSMPWESSPATLAQAAVQSLGLHVRYLLCTHAHGDHFGSSTLSALRKTFPRAVVHLQQGFEPFLRSKEIAYFDGGLRLNLGGEPLYLIHAPKHSNTDTHIIFRGSICTGDWELNTIRSVHDRRPGFKITTEQKLRSVDRLIAFTEKYNYHIHCVYSVHANDRRENVDFVALMNETKVDRQLW